ncbi:hypothetical protein [Janthinobacterium sp. 17J80-10]|uniref:hypothetical protein n=1 Tax=Janthinobacterium sp. 17J80-10 TaxID=2497863 RepID=UPI0010057D03|nr:hypothetical protein [Janthinobacterium sp. 17J80-10]QAU33183.1 hypothetical protein EKL02_02750 [Janthinobacterium sp. 17J80-10]
MDDAGAREAATLTASASQVPDETVSAGVLSAFLRAGRVVDHASSLLLLALTLLSLAQPVGTVHLAFLGIALALAMAEKYYAWRVALDDRLFEVLLRHAGQAQQFDAALAHMLGRQAPVGGRSLQGRCQGARRLLLRQALCLGGQVVATAVIFLLQIAKMMPPA